MVCYKHRLVIDHDEYEIRKEGFSTMIRYKSIPQTLFQPEIGTYRTYGIAAYEKGRLRVLIPDVFLDASEARAFADRCTRAQLDYRQLRDVVTDTVGVV